MSDYTEELLHNFADYLRQLQVSPSTYKNYLSDIRHYFCWSSSHSQPTEDVLSLPNLLAYRDSQTSKTLTTTNRRLSALRKLCQFAHSSQLITADPSPQLSNLTTFIPPNPNQDTLSQFTTFLRSQKISPITIKNYLSDIRRFLSLNIQPEIYVSQLQQTVTATNKRRLSSLKKFMEFQKPVPNVITPSPTPEPPPIAPLLDLSITIPIPVKTHIDRKTYIVAILIITFSLLLLTISYFILLPPHPPLLDPSPTLERSLLTRASVLLTLPYLSLNHIRSHLNSNSPIIIRIHPST